MGKRTRVLKTVSESRPAYEYRVQVYNLIDSDFELGDTWEWETVQTYLTEEPAQHHARMLATPDRVVVEYS